jgi:quercetin dioxygenase-like cupin family protein
MRAPTSLILGGEHILLPVAQQNTTLFSSRRVGVLVLAVALACALFSQNTGVQRTIVHRTDVSVPGREAVIARAEIAPGAHVGLHTHPGEEISYVMEGEAEILIEGRPPLKVSAGDGFVIPNGAKHDARNTGMVPLKLAVVYLVEKGKPIATPVVGPSK